MFWGIVLLIFFLSFLLSFLSLFPSFFHFLLSFFPFLDDVFLLLTTLECSDMISAHYNLHLPGSRDSHALVSQVARITGVCHHTWLIFVFLVEIGFHHVGQAALELLALSDLPASTSQSAEITGVSHHTWPFLIFVRQDLILLPRLQCSGIIMVCCSLDLLGSGDPPP